MVKCRLNLGSWATVCFILTLSAAGCNSDPQTVQGELSAAQARLLDIKLAYTRFQDQFRRPPRNKKDLLRTLETENPEETLHSPNDGQPFVICYGVNLYGSNEWAKPGTTAIIAYEKQGDGSRWVWSLSGSIYEMDEEEFQKSSFPPGH